MKKKLPTSIRLSAEAKRLLALLADKMGLSQAGVLETLIREKAKRLKVEHEPGDEDTRRKSV